MGRLFGTDGIRVVANKCPITPEMSVRLGKAAASIFKVEKKKIKIIIGKDTRISGDMIESALVAGICSMGGDAYLAGIISTPAVAFLTYSLHADAGIVISASHNPYYDNGIKFFNKNGYKLSDEFEEAIENYVFCDEKCSSGSVAQDPSCQVGRLYTMDAPCRKYADFLKKTLPQGFSMKGMKIVIDCSNGAASNVAPLIFSELGACVESIFNDPDGKNINKNCGSQHPEPLSKKVVEMGADLGIAFDGDGDRLIAVDERGSVLTGDQVLAICARYFKKKGILENDLVVSTVMSNMGLGIAFKNLGIKNITAQVGDRSVTEKMISNKAVIGGEDSGHMIFLNHHTTGDGILSALKLIESIKYEAKPLSEVSRIMKVLPQVILNVEVKEKPSIDSVPEIVNIIKSVEASLHGKGRVLVRYSGTQPLCRIMVEGPSIDETEKLCKKIADTVKETIGIRKRLEEQTHP